MEDPISHDRPWSPSEAPDSNPTSGVVPAYRDATPDLDSLPPPPSLRPPGSLPPPMRERLQPRKILRRGLDFVQDLLCTRSLGLAIRLAGSNWHSGYDSLHALFRSIRPRPGEILVDVGCGLGRVTAFLARRFPRNRVLGIESSDTALAARAALAFRSNIEVRHGDFFEHYPAEATLFYIYPPTEGDFLRRLKARIDETATDDTTIVARGALGGLGYFRADPTWTIERVPPPDGLLARLISTYSIYGHARRGPGYHFGAILRKTVNRRSSSPPELPSAS